MQTKPVAVYGWVSIYERKGLFTFYIGNFRFTVESLDEAYRIIDSYTRKDDEGC